MSRCFFIYFFQILHFIVAHSEVFSDILQEQAGRVTVSSLHELYLVSGIICKSGVTEDAFSDEETRFEDVMKLKAPLSRIQRLMLALLPKYSVRGKLGPSKLFGNFFLFNTNKIQSLHRLRVASATCNPISDIQGV